MGYMGFLCRTYVHNVVMLRLSGNEKRGRCVGCAGTSTFTVHVKAGSK